MAVLKKEEMENAAVAPVARLDAEAAKAKATAYWITSMRRMA